MACQVCHLMIADAALDRQCPFCQDVFSRVDSARRHAGRCPQRANRPLGLKKRGRKAFSCDRCTRAKIHCNAQVQNPCDGCVARTLECTFSRYCSCGDIKVAQQVHQRTDPSRLQQASESGKALTFLLHSTDHTNEFVTERAVGDEPEGALLGFIRASPAQERELIDAELLSGYIDPMMLLPSCGPVPFTPLHSEFEDQNVINTVLSLQSHDSDLAGRITSLESALVVHALAQNLFFDEALFRMVFTVSNVYTYARSFCRKRHYRYPLIHWPTFSLQEACLPLLLVVSLTGASYSCRPGEEHDAPTNARQLYPLADSFVFEQLSVNIGRVSSAKDIIELCQAALLMYGMDTMMAGSPAMQQTAITQRLPALVSVIRGLNLTRTYHNISDDWQLFVERESIIRFVAWTFCADCLASLSYNSPPLFTTIEMTGALPCVPALWDTDSAAEFDILRSSLQQHDTNSVKTLVSAFLNTKPSHPIELGELPLFHLHIVLCAFQPLIYNRHVAFTAPSEFSDLLPVLDKWLHVWHIAMDKIPKNQHTWLGVAKYLTGIQCLLRRTIEVILSPQAHESKYLQRIPSYSMHELHEFIRDFVVKT